MNASDITGYCCRPFRTAMAEVKCVINPESFQYALLPRLAKILLVLPQSNADPERLFRMVNKTCTEQRKV